MLRTAADSWFSEIPCSALPASLSYALQPIVDVHTGAVYAYEALLRGTDAAGYPSIDAFFDRTHDAGDTLSTEIALYGLAFATFRRLPDERGRKLFLNIDNRVLEDPAFEPAFVAALADRMGVPRTSVCLELSEKHRSAATERTVETLRTLRSAGIRLALDDFGQGYSELKLLYDAAPEYVKIDRFFVSGIDADARKRLFVSTVVDLAHVLGARVVAEGVESEAEFLTCRRIGCDLAQGWYIARPFREFTAMPRTYLVAAAAVIEEAAAPLDRVGDCEIVPAPAIFVDTPLAAVMERVRTAPDHSVFPVVDEADEPLGLLRESDLRAYGYAQFGRDLVENRSYIRHLRELVVRVPVVDIDSDVDGILDSLATWAGSDGVIVTRNLRYAGVLTSAALLTIANARRLSVAQDQNPLSRLPGNAAINAEVLKLAEPAETTRVFCYFDFNHFKPFNDNYGYRQGDRAITLFADILRRRFGEPGMFLGHVGGDDFVVAVEGVEPAHVEAATIRALETFRHDVESFYEPADRERGYLEAVDRQGRPQLFPLMTCSAAMLVVPPRIRIDSPETFSRLTAEGKRAAKLSRDNLTVRTLG